MRAGENFIFVHVPKTGGNSIGRVLPCQRKIIRLHDHTSYCDLPQDMCATRFTFGFVRNPWERLVSLFAFVGGHADPAGKQLLPCYRFRDVLLGNKFGELNKCRAARLGSRDAMWWLNGVDFVGRFENLQEDFDKVCDRIGIDRVVLPHMNRSKHKDYRSYYDDEMVEYVEVHHAETIERFGYTFEGGAGGRGEGDADARAVRRPVLGDLGARESA